MMIDLIPWSDTTYEGVSLHAELDFPHGANRGQVVKLTAGGTYVHDGGYHHEDREATITAHLRSKAQAEALESLHVNRVVLYFSDEFGTYKAQIKDLNVVSRPAIISLIILEKLMLFQDMVYPPAPVPVPVAWAGSLATTVESDHFAFLDGDGSLRGWGWNAYGMIDPTDIKDNYVSTGKILTGPFTKVVCGTIHTLLLDASGNVYGIGRNHRRQANPASAVDPWIDPTNVIATGCIDIAAGRSHSLALKSNGDVIGWGLDENGQSNPASPTHIVGQTQTDPTNVILSGCKAVFCSPFCSFAIKDNGDVIGWGLNSSGQIDPGGASPFVDTTNVIISNGAKVAGAQHYTTFLTTSGAVHALGSTFASVGFSSVDITTVFFTGASDIAVSAKTAMLLTTSGLLKIWGENTYGDADPAIVGVAVPYASATEIPDVDQIAVGWGSTHWTSGPNYYSIGYNDYNTANPLSATTPWVDLSIILDLDSI